MLSHVLSISELVVQVMSIETNILNFYVLKVLSTSM